MSWSRDDQGDRASRLSPRQSARGADPRRAQPDCREGAGGVHLRRCGALGRGQLGGSLPAFSRPPGTARRCGAPRLRTVRGAPRPRLERGQARPVCRLRECRPRLSRLRTRRTRFLLGDVRGGPAPRRRSRVARGRRSRFCGAAPGRRRLLRPLAQRPPAAGLDDEPAFVGSGARDRLVVCARRRGTPQTADDARRNCSRRECWSISAASA